MPRLLAILALLTSVTLFAGGFIAARFHFEAGGTPADVTVLRYGVAGLLTAPLALRAISRVGAGRAAALALTQGTPFGAFIFLGMMGAPIAHGSTIVPGLGLLIGVLGAVAFLGERLTTARAAGLALGLAGLAVLTMPAFLGAGSGAWWAELCYMVCGVLVATYTLLLKRWQIRPLDGAALAMTVSLPLTALVAILFEIRLQEIAPWRVGLQGLYQGVFFAVIGVWLYSQAISRLGPIAAVAATPLMPAVATGLDYSIFGSPLGPEFGAALALMAAAVFLLTRPSRPATAPFP